MEAHAKVYKDMGFFKWKQSCPRVKNSAGQMVRSWQVPGTPEWTRYQEMQQEFNRKVDALISKHAK